MRCSQAFMVNLLLRQTRPGRNLSRSYLTNIHVTDELYAPEREQEKGGMPINKRTVTKMPIKVYMA
jgi:hypothetical protein